jgi:Zn-dependent oligopeptidase
MSQDLNALTKPELQELAADLDIEGRSSMNKPELVAAIAEAQSAPPSTPESVDVSPETSDDVETVDNSDDPTYKARVARDEARENVEEAKRALRSARSQAVVGGVDLIEQRQDELDEAHKTLSKAQAAFDKRRK